MIQIPGQTTYPSTVGVMGTSVGALHLVTKSLISTKPWLRDPNVVPLPWRESIHTETLQRAEPNGSAKGHSPLKLGIYWTDNVVTPHPPISRGLRTVVDALKNAGHKVHNLSYLSIYPG